MASMTNRIKAVFIFLQAYPVTSLQHATDYKIRKATRGIHLEYRPAFVAYFIGCFQTRCYAPGYNLQR